MDWLIGGIVVVLVIVGGVAFSARARTPERLVTPSPAAGWDEALAKMPRGADPAASAQALEAEALLADTETAAVSPEALPPLDLDVDLDLTGGTEHGSRAALAPTEPSSSRDANSVGANAAREPNATHKPNEAEPAPSSRPDRQG